MRSSLKSTITSSIFALLTLAMGPSFAKAAGFWEVLSTGAYKFSDGRSCNPVDEAKALQKMNCTSAPLKEFDKLTFSMGDIYDASNFDAEKKYFKMLAEEQLEQLTCAKDFAAKLATDRDSNLSKTLQDRALELREAKQKLIKATQDLTDNKNIPQKSCPLSMPDLQNDNSAEDEFYKACEPVIKSRAAYQSIYNSIPLSNVHGVKEVLEKYSNLAEGPELTETTKHFAANFSKGYAEASSALDVEARRLTGRIGTNDFDRTEKAVLLSDPGAVGRVLEQSQNDPNVDALACRANARYGLGAEKLDNFLVAGTFAFSLGFGVVPRAVSVMNAVRATRGISIFALRTLQATAVAINVTSTVNRVNNACLNEKPTKFIIKKSANADKNQVCSDSFSAASVAQESCVLAASLSSLGYVRVRGVLSITEKRVPFNGPAAVKSNVLKKVVEKLGGDIRKTPEESAP